MLRCIWAELRRARSDSSAIKRQSQKVLLRTFWESIIDCQLAIEQENKSQHVRQTLASPPNYSPGWCAYGVFIGGEVDIDWQRDGLFKRGMW